MGVSDILLLGAGGGVAGWKPTDLANCHAWFDAADGGSISRVGENVDQWNDKAGGNHITQSTGAQKPHYNPGTIQMGSNNVDCIQLVNSAFMNMKSGSFTNITSAITLFLVLQRLQSASNCVVFSGDDVNCVQVNQKTTTQNNFYRGSDVSGGGTPDGNAHVFTVLFNGASSLWRQDGTQIGTFSPGTGNVSSWQIGRNYSDSQYWRGKIGEIIVYDADKTPDFSTVEQELGDKWGVTIA